MADIVVCYARKDHSKTEKLVGDLETRGYTVWWDPKIKGTDPSYIAAIFRELANARAAIVVWTPESVKSNNVIAEAKWALDRGILVPVIDALPPQQLPPPFNIAGNVVALADRPAIIAELYKIQVIPQLAEADDDAPSAVAAIYALEDVFRTDIPTVTMIDRSKEQEFKLFRLELRQPGRVLRVHGPSKSGKTVFARQALAGLHPIEMEGAQIKTLKQFYHRLGEAFPLDSEATKTQSVGDRLRKSRRPIIVDDFHRIPGEARRDIIMDAKGFLVSGVNLVLVSVPDCAKPIIEDDNDFLMRTKALRAPRWRGEKLQRIAKKGFKALNVAPDDRSLKALISEAFNNPFLVQHYCKALCVKKDVFHTAEPARTLTCERSEIEEIVANTAAEVATHFEKRVQLDGKVKLTLLSGRPITLQGLILASLTDVEINQRVGMMTIMRKIKRLVSNDEQSSLNRAKLLENSKALVTQLQGQSPSDLTIDMDDECLYILHPFFKVYLKWKLVPKLTHQPAKLVDWA